MKEKIKIKKIITPIENYSMRNRHLVLEVVSSKYYSAFMAI